MTVDTDVLQLSAMCVCRRAVNWYMHSCVATAGKCVGKIVGSIQITLIIMTVNWTQAHQ